MTFRLKTLRPLAAVVLAACHDTGAFATPQPTARKVAELSVARADSTVTVTVRVTGFAEVPVASVSGTVDFDATALRFVGDASPADGGVRAVRDAGGRVFLAAAHADGFREPSVMTLRFVTRATGDAPAADAGAMALGLRELTLVDATNALPDVLITPSAAMLRIMP